MQEPTEQILIDALGKHVAENKQNKQTNTINKPKKFSHSLHAEHTNKKSNYYAKLAIGELSINERNHETKISIKQTNSLEIFI